MSHKHRKAQSVTRREVLRIVQRARDEILSAIVHAPNTFTMHELASGHETFTGDPIVELMPTRQPNRLPPKAVSE